jgi:Zinc-finger associated domain (zf-AD)
MLASGPETLLPLVECYKTCAGVDLKMDGPKRICWTCEEKLKSFYEFREMCRASYKRLTEVVSIVVVKHEPSPVEATRKKRPQKKETIVVQESARPRSEYALNLESHTTNRQIRCLACREVFSKHSFVTSFPP